MILLLKYRCFEPKWLLANIGGFISSLSTDLEVVLLRPWTLGSSSVLTFKCPWKYQCLLTMNDTRIVWYSRSAKTARHAICLQERRADYIRVISNVSHWISEYQRGNELVQSRYANVVMMQCLPTLFIFQVIEAGFTFLSVHVTKSQNMFCRNTHDQWLKRNNHHIHTTYFA